MKESVKELFTPNTSGYVEICALDPRHIHNDNKADGFAIYPDRGMRGDSRPKFLNQLGRQPVV